MNLVEKLTDEYEKHLQPFNGAGAIMDVTDDAGESLLVGVVLADLSILRVNPHFTGKKGELVSTDVWVLWRPIGYEEDGLHLSHLIRVVEWEDLDGEVALTDDQDRRHVVRRMDSARDAGEIAQRRQWLQERPDLTQVNKEIREFFQAAADAWEDPAPPEELEEPELVEEKQL